MDIFRKKWTGIAATYSHPLIEWYGALVVQLLFFWIPCTIYLALDRIAPTFSHKHKIQPIPAAATRADIMQCLGVVVRNQAVSMAVHAVLLGANHLDGKPSNYRITAALPSALELLRDVALSVLVREVAFYYAHRTLHRPLFYARLHKTHHRFTAPFALAAQYATVPEHIFANVLPIALSGMLFRSHILSYWVFVASQLVDTATVHSGYDFFGRFAEMHDRHHELFNVNYGVFGLCDWLHGTNKIQKSTHAKE